ncbi:hypothetical protein [Nocardia fluminea]|uniref:hypothetical protein n=1 Tax=Nocardia fluminea TaxID=134984 RepID=UPI00365D73F0
MGLWEEAEEAEGYMRARQQEARGSEVDELAQLGQKQLGLIQEVLAGLRRLNAQPERIPVPAVRQTFAPDPNPGHQRYISAWAVPGTNFGIAPVGELVALAYVDGLKPGEVVPLPIRDRKDWGGLDTTGHDFERGLRTLLQNYMR